MIKFMATYIIKCNLSSQNDVILTVQYVVNLLDRHFFSSFTSGQNKIYGGMPIGWIIIERVVVNIYD